MMQDESKPTLEYAPPQRHQLGWPPFRAIVIYLVLTAIPEVFYRIYAPINAHWTVHTFGCGCPDFRTGKSRFPNANHINMCLYGVLALFLCIGCVLICRRYLKQWPPMARQLCMSGTCSIVLMLCMRAMAKSFWL